ncbi:helix-turn-helix domain-containing protein [Trichococcus collinsii]|uniref:Helix-turn-helix domain-containing protein n=1 Tax=Trichococcus collinsii TaxID=157076 RepID=A0AB37ZXZ0_9LACT|nr:helix-turn-helix transcriptional regulator [Trichococcus collinsii]CZQ80316.1 Hypothetical protein Tcol_30 [Trichococcus collinsii]SDZ93115.1 Helix-turn-helix domain-containing protein [Trichococcus collinsii]
MTEINFGSALRAFRESRKMSRKEFAEKAAVSLSRLSDLENNRYKNSKNTITNILEKFNYSYANFLIVYCGYKYEGRSFNTEESLSEYKARKNNALLKIEENKAAELQEDLEAEYYISMYENVKNYITNESTKKELEMLSELVDYFQWKKDCQ